LDQKQSDPSPEAGTLAAGTVVGRFVIVRILGSGAMGEVYLAEDHLLNRTVALKLISASIAADPDSHSRFVAEAQSAASLRHPNIVTIYEIGEFRDRPFIAMEYLAGGSLTDLLKLGPVPQDQAISTARQICLGLQAAHAAGIVHRDISPSNIMFDTDGTVRIVDFGVAQSGRFPNQSLGSLKVGTLAYMSPEQARGEKAVPGSDLFSLGVVLYELLTGRRPFSGEYEAAILYEIQNVSPIPPSTVSDIPARFDALVLKLLCKSPSDRFKSAADLLLALDESPARRPTARTSADSVARFLKIALPTLLVLAALALVYMNWQKIFPGPKSDQKRHAVAVLPFDNLGSPEDTYFADGMTDAVITSLARSGDITTISRTSSSGYRRTSKPVAQIGAELDVDYLVTGSVLWDKHPSSGKVRINAALVRISDDAQIWANSYERSLDHLFAIQEEIANDVGRALKIRLAALAHPVLQKADARAYDLYLQGNDYFNRGWSRSDITYAQSMYERAVKLDTAFALPYAMLSRCHSSMYWEYFDRTETRKREARQAADHALTLAPDLAEAHWASGYYYYHCELDYTRALAEFNTALAIEPGNADLLNAIAAVERRQGQLAESADHFMRALEIDPRSHLKAFDVGLTFGMMRRFGHANEYIERAITLAPDWDLPYLYQAWLAVLDSGNIAKAGAILSAAPRDAHLEQSKYYWWLKRLVEPDPSRALAELRPFDDTVAYFLCRAQLARLAGEVHLSRACADSARTLLEAGDAQQPRYHSSLGLAYAYLGKSAEAELFSKMAVASLPASRDAFDALFLLVNLAESYVVTGQNDKAIEQLRNLLSLPGFVSVPYLELDPLWRPLASNPGFKQLVATPGK
jgi:serine/threonine protein kinase/Tfp pilus assembly protein PilF